MSDNKLEIKAELMISKSAQEVFETIVNPVLLQKMEGE